MMTRRQTLLAITSAIANVQALQLFESADNSALAVKAANETSVKVANATSVHDDVKSVASKKVSSWHGTDWILTDKDLKSNNLGGQGPEEGEEAMRFASVATTSDGVDLDLVVTVVGDYSPYKSDSNKLKEGFGIVNVAKDSQVQLHFKFTVSGGTTAIDADLGKFRFTIYDMDDDEKDASNKEICIFNTPVKKILELEDTYLIYSGSNTEKDPYTFTSSENGKGSDNPEDPRDLTEEQQRKSVTAEYHGLTEWDVTLKVEGGKKGRNFMFAGRSNEPELACDGYDDANLVWNLCTHGHDGGDSQPVELKSNNLGGAGPSNSDAQEMRFSGVASMGAGDTLDLVATVNGNYATYSNAWNGQHNCFGVVNVLAGTSVTVDYHFEHTSDGSWYKLDSEDRFVFSVYDIDQSNEEGSQEVVTFDSEFESNSDAGADIQIVQSTAPYQIASKAFGSGSDNPYYDDPTFTPQNSTAGTKENTLARSFEVQYSGAKLTDSKWSVTYEAKGGLKGRNFLFGGCQTPVWH